MRFIFPKNGDCLNSNDSLSEGGLIIRAEIEASEGHRISICGKECGFSNGIYSAEIEISEGKSILTASDLTSGSEESVTVFALRGCMGKYRLSSDDNILFLQDITKNKDIYSSIFDNPYLAIYKKAHDHFGAKVHLNLFYEFFPNRRDFSDEGREYFNLSMMTDKFKDEFAANSDWLKLAFHANSEYPDKPYKNAAAEKIREDYLKVTREIVRFAGAGSISNSTTVHWGEANRECVRELRALGLRSLTGYFRRTAKGEPLVSYYFDGCRLDHIGSRDFFYDTDEDIFFAQIDLVLNEKSYEYVMSELPRIAKDPGCGGFISIMIHEQYFYSDYRRHLPDFESRVLDACAFLASQGYEGTHLRDIV